MHASKPALKTLIAATAFAASLFTARALAGDVAALNVLGFSGDGSVFAFEEYGIQDGSGFPYANRIYIDTQADAFLPGTPIRVRIDDDTATLQQARDQARATGEQIVSDDELATNRGFRAGSNPVTELSADPYRIVVNPRPVFPPVDAPMEFRLETIAFPVPANCEGLAETGLGFRLLSVDATAGGVTDVLHEDTSVPASRGCPTGYRIAGVQTFMPFQGLSVVAVLLAVRTFGFEGPDFNYMAVTRTLSEAR